MFPESDNPVAAAAVREFPEVTFLPAESLEEGAKMLARGEADTMISGLDYASREVLIAYKNHLLLKSPFFSSCFICEKDDLTLAVADGGVNKHPTEEQLYTIVVDTAKTFSSYAGVKPRVAMLSYSTYGSGGRDAGLDKIQRVIERVRSEHPDYLIDGELQLDAAVNPEIVKKKAPDSVLEGRANVLITPDLNSGNILYKSLEQFGGFRVAGPIIQGFRMPLADLSRGSTVEDVVLTIEVLKRNLK